MRLLLVIVLIFVCNVAYAYKVDVVCSQDGEVDITFEYYSPKLNEVSTAVVSRSIGACDSCLIKIPAYSVNGIAYLSFKEPVRLYSVECLNSVNEEWFQGLMGLAGIVAAGLLFYSIQSAFLS